MPVHERFYRAGDSTDLAPEVVDKYLGATAGGLGGEGEDPIGVTTSIPAPTGVSATDSATANAIDVSFTKPSGINKVEVLVFENASGKFVKKVEATTSPVTVTGLTVGVTYAAYVRGVSDDGKVGRSANKVTATVA